MKIRPVGTELFHAGGRTDRHDESNSRFLQFSKRAQHVDRIYECVSQNRIQWRQAVWKHGRKTSCSTKVGWLLENLTIGAPKNEPAPCKQLAIGYVCMYVLTLLHAVGYTYWPARATCTSAFCLNAPVIRFHLSPDQTPEGTDAQVAIFLKRLYSAGIRLVFPV